MFEKLREGLESRGFVQSQMGPCVWYIEDMVLLFYVDDCLMFIPSKDKVCDVYASLQADFKIKIMERSTNILQ